jgi:hypothetical protein
LNSKKQEVEFVFGLTNLEIPQGPTAMEDLRGSGKDDAVDDAEACRKLDLALACRGSGMGRSTLRADGSLRVRPVQFRAACCRLYGAVGSREVSEQLQKPLSNILDW